MAERDQRMNGHPGDDGPMGRALTPCGRTRREFLWEAGGGFVGTALATLLAGGWVLAAIGRRGRSGAGPRLAAGPQGAAFPGQGQGVHRPLHVRRRQPGRYLRPQARADPVPRQADPDARQRSGSQGAQSRACCWARRASSPGTARRGSRSPTFIRISPGAWTTWRSSAACTPTASPTARACSR